MLNSAQSQKYDIKISKTALDRLLSHNMFADIFYQVLARAFFIYRNNHQTYTLLTLGLIVGSLMNPGSFTLTKFVIQYTFENSCKQHLSLSFYKMIRSVEYGIVIY